MRNSSDLRNVHARTNVFYNSFIPSTIRAWNDLSDEIKTAPSVALFKYRLNNNLKKNLRNITMLALVLARSCMQDSEWNAVP